MQSFPNCRSRCLLSCTVVTVKMTELIHRDSEQVLTVDGPPLTAEAIRSRPRGRLHLAFA